MKEIWLPIKGYEGLYEVSNLGRVRSLGNGNSNNSKNRIMSLEKTNNDYFKVGLRKNNGKQKRFLVHRLVAEAFIPNWFNDPQVNHIDENPKNNRVDNLEWCDAKYNMNYGTRKERANEKLKNGKCSKIVLQLTLEGKLLREWPSTMECGRNGFDQGTVAACCRGNTKHKTHKGFIWKYKEVV